MDMSRLVKLVVVVAVLFCGWKYGLPWIKAKTGSSSSSSASSSDNSCISNAERASQVWGSGLAQFANPPYDLNAWSAFSASVNSSITASETACGCAQESCAKVQSAMKDLKSLVNDMDSSIRSGQPPAGDLVQRQADIDAKLDSARDLVRAGK
jgi:hypothetical protein